MSKNQYFLNTENELKNELNINEEAIKYDVPEMKSQYTNLSNTLNNQNIMRHPDQNQVQFPDQFPDQFLDQSPNQFPDQNIILHDDLFDLLNPNENNSIDIEKMRILWKKEKNRIAAKKSREKKAYHIKELEKREKKLSETISIYKNKILNYDELLNIFLYFIYEINEDIKKTEIKNYNEILISILKRLKDKNGFYIGNIIGMKKLLINDEKIERLIEKKEKEKYKEEF